MVDFGISGRTMTLVEKGDIYCSRRAGVKTVKTDYNFSLGAGLPPSHAPAEGASPSESSSLGRRDAFVAGAVSTCHGFREEQPPMVTVAGLRNQTIVRSRPAHVADEMLPNRRPVD